MRITPSVEQDWTTITRTLSYDYLLEEVNLSKFREKVQTLLKELEVSSVEDVIDKIMPHIKGADSYKLHVSATDKEEIAEEMLTLNCHFYADDRNGGYEYRSISEVAEIICGCLNLDDFGKKNEHKEYVNGKFEHNGPIVSSPRMNNKEFIILKTQRTSGEKEDKEYAYNNYMLCIYIPKQ